MASRGVTDGCATCRDPNQPNQMARCTLPKRPCYAPPVDRTPPVSAQASFSPETDLLLSNAVAFYNLLCDIREKGVALPKSAKNTVFLMLTELAFDHHAAILKLVEARTLVSSALALVRTLMETVGRAIWVHRRGSEQKLRHMIETPGCDLPDYSAMALAVDQEITALGAGTWFTLPPEHIKELHSLTHSGKAALAMRIDPDGVVAPTYPAGTVQRLLRRSASFAALNGIIYSQVASGRWEETSEGAKEITDHYKELFGTE